MSPDAVVARAQSLLDLNRAGEALAVLRAALAQDPQSYRLLCLLALAHYKAQSYNDARLAAGHALGVRPDGEWAHRIASLSYRALDWPGRAVEHALEAVRLAPASWQSHHVLALAMSSAGHHKNALQHAQMCVHLAPDEAEAYFAQGLCAMDAGDRKLAQAAFERTLQLEPDHAVAHNNLAKLFIDRGGIFKGASSLGAALTSDAQLTVAQHNVGILARRMLFYFHVSIFVGYHLLEPLFDGARAKAAALRNPRFQSSPLELAAIAMLLLAISAVIVADSRMPRNLRGYFRRLPLTDRVIGVWLTAEVLALLLTISVAAPISYGTRGTLQSVGGVCLAVGAAASWVGYFRARRSVRGQTPLRRRPR